MMALELTKPKRMSVTDIIEKDIKTNNHDISLEQGMAIFKMYMDEGVPIIRVRNTLFIIEEDTGEDVYYHTVNADPIKSFLTNCLAFFSLMRKQNKEVAISYFDGPKMLKILRKHKLPNEDIEKSDDPKKGEYMVITYLQEGSK
jgi:hypothetical protein